MSIMVAVDLLGCTGSTEERAALLHKTIQLAAELKSNLGNMFGFAAVMRALEMPQVRRTRRRKTCCLGVCFSWSTNGTLAATFVITIQVVIVFLLSASLQISRLEQTWVTLRQRHTEGAILYEKKLKPFMKNMNDCQGRPLAPTQFYSFNPHFFHFYCLKLDQRHISRSSTSFSSSSAFLVQQHKKNIKILK